MVVENERGVEEMIGGVERTVVGLEIQLRTLATWLSLFFSSSSSSSTTVRRRRRRRAGGFFVVTGDSGCGKTSLAEAIAKVSGLKWARYSASQVHLQKGGQGRGSTEGECEQQLIAFFERFVSNCSSSGGLILLEDLDLLAPKRAGDAGSSSSSSSSELVTERRVSAQFLQLVDGLQRSNSAGETNVAILALTSRLSEVDGAFLRPFRFENVLLLPIPDPDARLRILTLHLLSSSSSLSEAVKEALIHIRNRTHGFVGGDLECLCRDAKLSALRRHHPLLLSHQSRQQQQQRQPPELLPDIGSLLLPEDLFNAFNSSGPSVLRSTYLSGVSSNPLSATTSSISAMTRKTVENIFGEQLAGMDEVVDELTLCVIVPLRIKQHQQQQLGQQQPSNLASIVVSGPRGILLYGPSGTGKTTLALCLARAAGINVITVKGSELLSKVVGESERAITQLFRTVRAAAPAILLIDQMEVLTPRRSYHPPQTHYKDEDDRSGDSGGGNQAQDRLLSCLLVEMDGVIMGSGDVTVIGTTTQREMMDEAVLRPGRLDRHILVPLPNLAARQAILLHKLINIPIYDNEGEGGSTEEVKKRIARRLSEVTEGMSGAELENICREVALERLRKDIHSTQLPSSSFFALLGTTTQRLVITRLG
jgi:SpoVK/Ycf46/Vps4 family AAA+-type ATPase